MISGGVTSITGEKLYEGQFLDAMQELDSQHRAIFYLLLADEDASRYVLYLESSDASAAEAFSDALDQQVGLQLAVTQPGHLGGTGDLSASGVTRDVEGLDARRAFDVAAVARAVAGDLQWQTVGCVELERFPAIQPGFSVFLKFPPAGAVFRGQTTAP